MQKCVGSGDSPLRSLLALLLLCVLWAETQATAVKKLNRVTASMCRVTVSAHGSMAGAAWSFVTANSVSSDDTFPAVPTLAAETALGQQISEPSQTGLRHIPSEKVAFES